MNNLKEKIKFNIPDELLTEALTHRSYINELKDPNIRHNERLEFIGDAVLELVVTDFLFKKYPDQSEGVMTSYRAALVKTESLASEARRLHVGEYILMSKGEEQTGGRDRTYILANTVEAIIGALYLSNGYDACKTFIEENICYKIDSIAENRSDIDAKSKLQEISQEYTKITPIYELSSANGPDHDKLFTMKVMIGQFEFGTGSGKSKQDAQQKAAEEALNNWENLYTKYFAKA
jgi:ribonuclease-3